MWKEIAEESLKTMRLAEQELAAAAVGTMFQLQKIMWGAALFFLQQFLPSQSTIFSMQSQSSSSPKGPPA